MNENLKEITKNTLEKLRQKNLPTTPENYFLEFKEQAKIPTVIAFGKGNLLSFPHIKFIFPQWKPSYAHICFYYNMCNF